MNNRVSSVISNRKRTTRAFSTSVYIVSCKPETTGNRWNVSSGSWGLFASQVEEFKYLGILFLSDGRMEQQMDRRIRAPSSVMMVLLHLDKELSQKAKL